MEVLMGPTTFGGGDARARLFLGGDEGAEAIAEATPPEDSSETSSSIGDPDDSDDEDDDGEDVAQSKFRGGGGSLASLDALEDSLPIKRGLSNHFSGKSKSFASLADVCTVRDLKKTEHPLNKKRRLLRASKWSKKSFYSWSNPKSMPLLALKEDDDDDEHSSSSSSKKQDDRDDHSDDQARRFAKFDEKRMKSFKMRCFSLADLQEHSLLEEDEDDEEEDDNN